MRRKLILFVALASLIPIGTLQSQVTWQKHPGAVVPVWEGNINDPSAVRYTYNPSVMFDSVAGIYKMWYCYLVWGAGTKWSLGYAISLDGIRWYTYTRNPVLEPGLSGEFDSQAIFDPFVIKVGNQYRLYYDGYNGTHWQTGIATSADGISWTKYTANPVLAIRPGTWESMACNTPKVFSSGNGFVMFYTGHRSLTEAEVGMATSQDGFVWQRSPLNPVLRRGPVGSWDQNSIRGAGAFYGNGKYYFFYDGGALTSIGFATSSDGVTWTKHPANPVLRTGPAGAWDAARIELGSLIKEGSVVKFWYSGYGFSSKLGLDVWQIGYATSPFVTSISETGNATEQEYRLWDAFPNPFNPETTIEFDVPAQTHVAVTVFDALGREVAVLVNDVLQRGKHSVRWQPASVASGVYYCRMQSGTFSQTRKLLLLR